MSADYWMGVVSVPALLLGAAVCWLAIKAFGWVGERLLVGGLIRFTPATEAARC